MKKITEHLGELIVALAGVCLLISIIVLFKAPIGNFFDAIFDTEVSVGNKVVGGFELDPDDVIFTEHAHAYGPWQKVDDEYHVRGCACGKTEIDAHNFVFVDNGDGTKSGTCSDCDFSLTIENGTLLVSSRGYEGVYDESAHGISVTCDGATITYSTSENGTYSSTNPKYTNAGTYTTYYRVTKSGYTTVTGSETVNITQAAGKIELSVTSGTVLGNTTGQFTVTKNTSGGELSVTSSNTSVATVSITNGAVTITPASAGTATITVTSKATTNYTAASATYNLTVTLPKLPDPIFDWSSYNPDDGFYYLYIYPGSDEVEGFNIKIHYDATYNAAEGYFEYDSSEEYTVSLLDDADTYFDDGWYHYVDGEYIYLDLSRYGEDDYYDEHYEAYGYAINAYVEVTSFATGCENSDTVVTETNYFRAEDVEISSCSHNYVYEQIEGDDIMHRRYCSVCGDSTTQVHSFDEGTVISTPSSSSDGITRYTCSMCGYEKDVSIPYDHICSFDTLDYDSNGHWYKCECGEISNTSAHNWSEWEVTVEATCTKSGVERRACTVCGYVQIEDVPALGHDFTHTRCDTEHECSWTAECGGGDGSVHKWTSFYHSLCSRCDAVESRSYWCGTPEHFAYWTDVEPCPYK